MPGKDPNIIRRTTILRATASGGGAAAVFASLEKSSEEAKQRVAALKSFTSTARTKVSTVTQVVEWVTESKRLDVLSKRYEREVEMALEASQQATLKEVEAVSALELSLDREGMHVPSSVEGAVYKALQRLQALFVENDETRERKKATTQLLQSQIKELRAFLKDFKKTASRKKIGKPVEDGQSDSESQLMVFASFFSDLLLKYRTGHSDTMASLASEEEQLSAEVAASAIKINHSEAESVRRDLEDNFEQRIAALLGNELVSLFNSTPREEPLSARDASDNRKEENTSRGEGFAVDDNGLTSQDGSIENSQSRLSKLLESCTDTTLLQMLMETQEKSSELEKNHLAELAALEANRVEITTRLGLPDNDAYAGWNVNDHQTLVKIIRAAEAAGQSRKRFEEALIAQLPEFPLSEIKLHEEWYRQTRQIFRRIKESKTNYTTKRREILDRCVEAVREQQQRQREEAEREWMLREQEERRKALHQRLDQLRVMNEEKSAAAIALAEEESRREEAEKEARAEALRREQNARKELVAAYHAKRRKEETERAAKEAEEKRIADEKLKELLAANRPKVELRHAQWEEKQARKRAKEEAFLVEEARKLELLQKLAEQVPYFQAIQDAHAKLDHVTASAAAHAYAGAPERARGHIPLDGFTDTKIISDTRFRLAFALQKAGLQHSDAARAVVDRFHPRPQLQIHGIL